MHAAVRITHTSFIQWSVFLILACVHCERVTVLSWWWCFHRNLSSDLIMENGCVFDSCMQNNLCCYRNPMWKWNLWHHMTNSKYCMTKRNYYTSKGGARLYERFACHVQWGWSQKGKICFNMLLPLRVAITLEVIQIQGKSLPVSKNGGPWKKCWQL